MAPRQAEGGMKMKPPRAAPGDQDETSQQAEEDTKKPWRFNQIMQ